MTPEVAARQYIAEALAPNELLTISLLSRLNCLSVDDLEYFKQLWPGIPVDRKRHVISQLVKLSQDNFRLNFSEIFVYCLYDTDSRVRANAIAGLSGEENYCYISPLVHILKKDTTYEVKDAAVKALGNFAMLGANGKLSETLVNKMYDALLGLMDDASTEIEIKSLALEAIAPLNLPRVKGLIEDAYRSYDTKLKTSAVRAMGRTCDPLWLTTLRNVLQDANKELRHEAIIAIGELGSEEALPDIVKLLKDGDVQIQEAAIRALSEVGGDESRRVLTELARSPQEDLRRTARLALKELDFCSDPLNPNL